MWNKKENVEEIKEDRNCMIRKYIYTGKAENL